ncbi:hypothetical protein [Amycolatopsis taiwanensis]|uniref:hypothetical protein n=1 Tax=Amycolatopsis taiwanensis TaxID=342230 RepID=UPI00146FB396|nr:hypothetical protein [Amycolatopsis taiwanensis]
MAETARSKLGTATIKDTVNAALRLAASSPDHDEIEAALNTLESIELDDRQHACR